MTAGQDQASAGSEAGKDQASDARPAGGPRKGRGASGGQTFRSPVAVAVWWIWLVFAVANLIDLAVQGHDHVSLVAAFVLILVTGVVYVAALRPRIIADDAALTIINPLRDHRIGWVAVAGVDATDLVRVRCEWPAATGSAAGIASAAGTADPAESVDELSHKTIYAWAVHSSRRRAMTAQARADRRARSRRGSLGTGFSAGSGYSPGPGFSVPSGSGGRFGMAGAGFGGLSGRGLGTPAPEPGDTDRVVTALIARADAARTAVGMPASATSHGAATAPVSSWYWPAFAAIGVPALALLISILA